MRRIAKICTLDTADAAKAAAMPHARVPERLARLRARAHTVNACYQTARRDEDGKPVSRSCFGTLSMFTEDVHSRKLGTLSAAESSSATLGADAATLGPAVAVKLRSKIALV